MKLLQNQGVSPLGPTIGVLLVSGITALRAEPVADFALDDRNTTSPRYDTTVSPRDYRHQVSGYYFGDPN